MNIQTVTENSPLLTQVKKLWRSNSSTLGLFPQGAFDDYATKKQIICVTEGSDVIGYLLYRISQRQRYAFIVHLCIAKVHRKKGVTRLLFTELVRRTGEYQGVRLRCRKDYAANALWQKLGFVAINETPGKSKEGHLLVSWLYSYGQPSLFDLTLDQRQTAAIDANVFFDMVDTKRLNHEESTALLSSWLEDDLRVAITDEIFNEISRSSDSQLRSSERKKAQEFERLRCNHEEFEKAQSLLRPLFTLKTLQDESDLRQLARAIGSDADFFVTRDENLLKKEESIYSEFGITIVTPSDLITRLDEVSRGAEYQPSRLAGSKVQRRLVRGAEEDELGQIFQSDRSGESRASFRDKLRQLLSNISHRETFIIHDQEQNPLCLCVLDRSKSDYLEIPLLRVARNPLALTIARHLLFDVSSLAVNENRSFTLFTDSFVTPTVEAALYSTAFTRDGNGWIKLHLSVIGDSSYVASKIRHAIEKIPDHAPLLRQLPDQLREAAAKKDLNALLAIEKVIWPAKITDLVLPCFIIPIRPIWAMNLFDFKIANQDLFGAAPELALSPENVYYRSAYQRKLSAPSRILWYVSGSSHQGTKQLRATSYVESVDVGFPKELFAKYKKLGIYEWKDVWQVARRKTDQPIMAFRFSQTELLKRSVSWNDLQSVLLQVNGKRNQLQSPVEISNECFIQLYKMGTLVEEK